MLSHFSHVQLFVTPWTVAHQAPLSMGFSRLEYWSGLPCLPPGYLPYSEIERRSLMSPVLAGKFFTTGTIWEAPDNSYVWYLLPTMMMVRELEVLLNIFIFSVHIYICRVLCQQRSVWSRLWFFQWSCMDVRVRLSRNLRLKMWCFWTMVLEKTLESPLDCKEIQQVHPKGDQSWVFFERTDAVAETPIL